MHFVKIVKSLVTFVLKIKNVILNFAMYILKELRNCNQKLFLCPPQEQAKT